MQHTGGVKKSASFLLWSNKPVMAGIWHRNNSGTSSALTWLQVTVLIGIFVIVVRACVQHVCVSGWQRAAGWLSGLRLEQLQSAEHLAILRKYWSCNLDIEHAQFNTITTSASRDSCSGSDRKFSIHNASVFFFVRECPPHVTNTTSVRLSIFINTVRVNIYCLFK